MIVLVPEKVRTVLKYFFEIISEDASTMAKDDITAVVMEVDILGYSSCDLKSGWYMSSIVSRRVRVLVFPSKNTKVFDFHVG